MCGASGCNIRVTELPLSSQVSGATGGQEPAGPLLASARPELDARLKHADRTLAIYLELRQLLSVMSVGTTGYHGHGALESIEITHAVEI